MGDLAVPDRSVLLVDGDDAHPLVAGMVPALIARARLLDRDELALGDPPDAEEPGVVPLGERADADGQSNRNPRSQRSSAPIEVCGP